MNQSQSPVYRPALGFALAFTTAVLWGVLPVFLKLSLMAMDSATITTYRFYSAALVVLAVLLWRKQFPRISALDGRGWFVCVVAAAMLVVNYVATVEGLVYLNPESVQVLMQIAPFLLMIGGVFIYREVFTRKQFVGAITLMAGLLLFFYQRIPMILSSSAESPVGLVFVIIAAVCWAAYALCQKPLLSALHARQLTFLIYILGGSMLLPFAELGDLHGMNALQLWALLFCCANTLVAYGAFTHAMGIWEASKVSAVIALAPLFAILSTEWAINIWPDIFTSSELDWVAYIGAGMVIVGSMLAALGRSQRN